MNVLSRSIVSPSYGFSPSQLDVCAFLPATERPSWMVTHGERSPDPPTFLKGEEHPWLSARLRDAWLQHLNFRRVLGNEKALLLYVGVNRFAPAQEGKSNSS